MQKKIIGVVGSGLSSLACVSRLLNDPEVKIVIIDDFKDDNMEINSKLKVFKNKINKTKNYFDRLKIYYSNFKKRAYKLKIYKNYFNIEVFNQKIFSKDKKLNIYTSQSYGGFSKIWGGVINKPMKEDLINWPVSFIEIEKYFNVITDLLTKFKKTDTLNEANNIIPNGKVSNICNSFYKKILRNKKKIKLNNIYFQKTNLALLKKNNNSFYCNECGFCMHGCPSDLIFNSTFLFDRYLTMKNVNYIRGKVHSYKEDNNVLSVMYLDHKDGNYKKLTLDYLFVGAGCINTSMINISSIEELENKKINIYTNDNYISPVLLKNIKTTPLIFEKNSMAQISFVIKEDITKKNNIYFQLYEFSDIVMFKFIKLFINNFFLPTLLNNIPFLSKILFAQFFINSENSSTLIIRGNQGKFHLSICNNKKSKKIISKAIKKINENKNLEVKILKFFLKKFYTGESYHWGSSFKMKKVKDLYSTDIYGRPYGFNKVSIIDSTVLPTLPSNTHTFLTMCNSYRITEKVIEDFF